MVGVGDFLVKFLLPGKMTTVIVNIHFRTLEFIKFFPNCCLIFRSKSCPRLVCSSIIIVSLSNFNVIIEAYNL